MNQSRLFPWLVLLFFFGTSLARRIALFVTDWMWFDAMGHQQVFMVTLAAQLGTGLVTGGIVGLSIWLSGRLALHHTRNRPMVLTPEWRGSWLDHWARQPGALEAALRATALVTGGLAGLIGSASWMDVLACLHGQPFSFRDPILDLDVSFYIFTFPVLFGAAGLATIATFLAGVAAMIIYSSRGAIALVVQEIDGELGPPLLRADPGPRRHLASLTATLALLLAVQYQLRRYAVLYGSNALMDGAGYTDVQVVLPLLTLQAVVTALAAFFVFQAIDQLRGGWFVLAVLMVIGTTLTSAFVPGLVQRLYVLPNEFDREAAFLSEHIRASREAWGLGDVEERTLTGEAKLSYDDIQANDATLQNVRLWDHQPLLETFRQVQEIRTYYEFSGVDNDRYIIDGELRQTMLSPRELDVETLPEAAQTWVNRSLVYTHGYGVALGPVNRVTGEGLPYLFVQDIPPVVSDPTHLGIDRPEIYYGEEMHHPVFVRTGEREFDYPTADGNAYTTYEGDGGVPVGSFLRRAMLALRLGSLEVLLSSDIHAGSRLLLYRQVLQRVERIAPFLWIDDDPYMAIADGRLVWILDAYTHSDRFPYSAHRNTPITQRPNGEAWPPRSTTRPRTANYLRNSVKVVVDAYDGTVQLYRVDTSDPIAASWDAAFPGLFSDIGTMSDAVREHLRYPRTLFQMQGSLFSTFHMTDSKMFYNREDEWELPFWEVQANERSNYLGGQNVEMEPYYTIMKLPGEEEEEFILMLPFVPKGKANLAAWMVARSDSDAYGSLRVYRFPKDRLIYGPGQIVSRILQNDLISEKLTLWNQQTSEAELGTLLVIPVEESLVYLRPLYLRASSDAIPELKRVLVAYENRIAMAPTLEEGLQEIFGVSGTPAAADLPEIVELPDTTFTTSDDWRSLADEAARHYEAALEASRTGRWADFGEELDRLGEQLEALRSTAQVPTEPNNAPVPDDAPSP